MTKKGCGSHACRVDPPAKGGMGTNSGKCYCRPESDTPRTDALVGDFDFPWSYQMEILVRHAEMLEKQVAMGETLLRSANNDVARLKAYLKDTFGVDMENYE
jgi:hypothetical protein